MEHANLHKSCGGNLRYEKFYFWICRQTTDSEETPAESETNRKQMHRDSDFNAVESAETDLRS